MSTKRIELIVLDIAEHVKLTQDIRIIKNGNALYNGGVAHIPCILLNEKVIRINTSEYYPYLIIEIE